MTRYTVVWSDPAQNQLARIWLEASDKQAVTAAANAIDAELAADAEKKGGELHEGLRTLDILPLHVLFTVSPPDRMVRVVTVRADSPSPQKNGQPPPPS
jgi:plasmid stabilization system protein ParE